MSNYEGWTNERVDELIKEKGLNIKRLTDVTGWRDKVTFKCLDCGYEYTTIPYVLKRGSGCPKCAIEKRKGVRRKAKYTLKEVKAIVEKNGKLILLSNKYENMQKPLVIRCKECGTTFERPLISFIRRHDDCPKCRKNNKD